MTNLVRSYLRALTQPFTFDGRRNYYLWFGILWGLPVPVFSVLLDLTLGPEGARSVFDVVRQHPIHLLFLAHPLLFGVVFGAMGTVRRELEIENERLIERLTVLAELDPLTGLRNRRVVQEALLQSIRRAERSPHPPVSVVLFDLDGFKAVNDRQGHAVGDAVLRKVAHALNGVLRQGEVLGRYGGDEFLLVANDALPDAQALVERARHAIEEATGLSASAGVARWPTDGATPEALVRAADAALAAEKRERYETRVVRRPQWTDDNATPRA